MACYDEGLEVADDDIAEAQPAPAARDPAVAYRAGRPKRLTTSSTRSRPRWPRTSRTARLIARHALAVAYLNADQPLDAADVAEEALAHLDRRDDPRIEIIRHVLAQAFRALQQPDNALEQLALVADSGRRRDSDGFVAEMNEQMGDLLDGLDRDAEAATSTPRRPSRTPPRNSRSRPPGRAGVPPCR